MSYVQRRKITADKKPCIKQPVWLDLPATVLTATVPAKGQPPVMTFLLPPGALPRSQSDAHPPEQMLALFRSFPRASRQKELKMEDRKSTRLNSSHVAISYAVFCLKKKKKMTAINVMRT